MQSPSRFGRQQERAHWIGQVARVLAGGCLWMARPALAAAPDSVSARLVWTSTSCPDISKFPERVAWRTEHARFVEQGEQLRFELSIQPAAGGGLTARVRFGQPRVTRQITSPDCNDAFDALALVVAIGVDERWREERAAAEKAGTPAVAPERPTRRGRAARPLRTARRAPAEPKPSTDAEIAPEVAAAPESPVQPEVAAEPESAPTEAVPEVAVIPPPAGVESAPRPTPTPPMLEPVAPPPVSPTTPRAPAFSPFAWGGGVSARVLSGAAPAALLGGEVWLRGSWQRSSVWSPELGLSLGYAQTEDVVRPDGDSHFKLERFGGELCPLRWGSRSLEFRPCATGEYGRFTSEGQRTFRAHRETRPWVSVGANAEGVVYLGYLQLRAVLGLAHPLIRDSVRFGLPVCTDANCDDGVFHRVAAIVGLFGVGAGVSFR